MKKNIPQTIALKEFKKRFNKEQKQQIQAEIKYYDLLVTFKEARKFEGLTQEELAKKADVNRTTLSQLESGSRNATIDTLMRLAHALGRDLKLSLA